MSQNDPDPPDPISGVGSERAENPPIDTRNGDNQWRDLFERQNDNMQTLIRAISTPNTSNNRMVLPEFNPDKAEVDARSWCATADLCFADYPLHGGQLVMAISKALKGTASTWLAQVSYPGMTWLDFKDLFIARFVCTQTNAGTLINFSNDKPQENESLSAYASRLISLLMTRWNDASKEQIAVSTVLAHISQFDSRLQRLAFTTEIKSRQELQKELQAFTFLKRKFALSNNAKTVPDYKRPKFSNPTVLKCFHCGKIGHRQSDCRQKGKDYKPRPPPTSASTAAPTPQPPAAKPSSIVCFKCGATGHVASRCTNGTRPAGSAQPERRVDLCVVEPPSGTLEHQVASDDSAEERSLTIATAPVIGVVGEKKAIYCKGNNVNSTDMEWLDPRSKIVPLRSSKNNRVYVENYKSKGLLVLIIFSLQLEDSGNWTCRTKDEELNEVITIFAGIKANFSGDDERKVEEGNAVKLTCRTKGFPTPQVYWTSENHPKPIETDSRTEIRKDDNKGIYTLIIKHANYQDAGVYYCKLYQEILKHHASKKITVEIIHKPIMFDAETNLTIEEPPKGSTTASIKEIFVVINEPKTIRCAAVGNPRPQFIWSYKDENSYFKEIKDEYMITHDDYSSNLTFTITEEDGPTMFRCLAKNDKGKTMLLYDVHIGNKPDAPDDIKFVNANTSFINFEVTCSNCTFDALDPERLPVIGYGFELVPHEEGYPPNWQNSTMIRVPIENVTVTTFSVGPLEKGTTYHVRVCSFNQASDSDWLEMSSYWLEFTKTDHATRLGSTLLLLATALFITLMCY